MPPTKCTRIFMVRCVFFQQPKAVTLESLAIVLVQLLSLSMGIAYDNVSECHCGVSICVMNPEAM